MATSRAPRAHAYNAVSAVSALVIAAAAGWAAVDPQPPREERVRSAALPSQPVSLAHAATQGDARAPLALIVFSDFQCPFCRSFARTTLPALIDPYVGTGKLLVAFRHFPLESIHSDARRAAELAECARRRGEFWPLHDAIFRDTEGFEGDWLARAARAAGVRADFSGCSAEDAAERVRQDVAIATALDIRSTPTILLGPVGDDGLVRVARVLPGASTPERLAREIESLLDLSKAR